MQRSAILTLLVLLAPCAEAARALRVAQEPDTTCGKGFDKLVQGSQDYYTTAAVKLWAHPYHGQDNNTFEEELQCWFANMCTTKCGGMPSQAGDRKKKLTATCLNLKKDWRDVWYLFSDKEVQYFKKNYPSEDTDGEGDSKIHYKQAMETVKIVNKKELLCLTLFTIDDECVKYKYIRMADYDTSF